MLNMYQIGYLSGLTTPRGQHFAPFVTFALETSAEDFRVECRPGRAEPEPCETK
jgi:hypothetical protein